MNVQIVVQNFIWKKIVKLSMFLKEFGKSTLFLNKPKPVASITNLTRVRGTRSSGPEPLGSRVGPVKTSTLNQHTHISLYQLSLVF